LHVFNGFEQANPKTSSQGVDRPGRLSDGMGNQHRSAVQETDWHRLAKHEFAHKIASLLEQDAQADRYEQLVVVAPSVILGELRKSISGSVSSRIVAEVAKDLTGHPVPEIEKAAFRIGKRMNLPTVTSVTRTFDSPVATITLDETARHRRRMRWSPTVWKPAQPSPSCSIFPQARLLSHGDGLVLDDGRVIEIRAMPKD
jgi:protein required for attachment to host cells